MNNFLRGVALSSIVAAALFVSGCSTGEDVAQKTKTSADQTFGGPEQPPPPPPPAAEPPAAQPPAAQPPAAEPPAAEPTVHHTGERG